MRDKSFLYIQHEVKHYVKTKYFDSTKQNKKIKINIHFSMVDISLEQVHSLKKKF